MAWFYLIIAAIFEVGWPLGFKFSWFALVDLVGLSDWKSLQNNLTERHRIE